MLIHFVFLRVLSSSKKKINKKIKKKVTSSSVLISLERLNNAHFDPEIGLGLGTGPVREIGLDTTARAHRF